MKEKLNTDKFINQLCDKIKSGSFTVRELDQSDDGWAYSVSYTEKGSNNKIEVNLDLFDEDYVLNQIYDACHQFLRETAMETEAILLAHHIGFKV